MILANRSTCLEYVGQQPKQFYSCDLDLGIFTCAVTGVTAGHLLSPLWEGAAFVSQVSLYTSSFLVECQISAICPALLAVQQIRCRSHCELLHVQQMPAEHQQINHTAQSWGILCIWDVAELL